MGATIDRLSAAFPFGPTSVKENDDFTAIISPHFPDRLRAWSLCELYYGQFAWSVEPVKRDELINEFLAPTYKQLSDGASYVLRPHRCAVLFCVFAIGAWVDITVEHCKSFSAGANHMTLTDDE